MKRPEDVKARIAGIGQIEGIIGAMRALAAAHEHEAVRHLDAIQQHAVTVERAMGRTLALLNRRDSPGATADPGPHRHLRIVVGAAQGFSGPYNEQILVAALKDRPPGASPDIMAIGLRCAASLTRRGVEPVWSSNMAAHAAEIPTLASRAADAVFKRFAEGRATQVSIVHGAPAGSLTEIHDRQVLPMQLERIGAVGESDPPLTTLPPDILVARLIEEYVFTELCRALMMGFAAENDARLKAMSRAKANVARIATDLKTEFAQAMQEQTTTEIIELSQGE